MKLHLEGIRLERNPGLYGRFIGGFPSEDIRLRVVETGEISPRPQKPVFEMPGHWRLHGENGQRLFEICDPLTARPNRVAEMDAGLKEGVIRLGTEGQRDLFGRPQSKRPRRRNLATILEPLLRILLADRLGTEDGLMLHAAAFDLGGRGIVFAGPSGSGKSTLSRLFAANRPDAIVIGDEHTILRKRDGTWTVYGTPWPGSAFAVAPGGVPLSRIYIIHHDRRNRTCQQPASLNFAGLLSQTFLPVWNDDARCAALFRIGDLAQDWTEKLGFVNSPEITDHIAKEIEHG